MEWFWLHFVKLKMEIVDNCIIFTRDMSQFSTYTHTHTRKRKRNSSNIKPLAKAHFACGNIFVVIIIGCCCILILLRAVKVCLSILLRTLLFLSLSVWFFFVFLNAYRRSIDVCGKMQTQSPVANTNYYFKRKKKHGDRMGEWAKCNRHNKRTQMIQWNI